jgi:hypothetical protein
VSLSKVHTWTCCDFCGEPIGVAVERIYPRRSGRSVAIHDRCAQEWETAEFLRLQREAELAGLAGVTPWPRPWFRG